jgi:protein-disulfide isomerase-like protein with CxxC motif
MRKITRELPVASLAATLVLMTLGGWSPPPPTAAGASAARAVCVFSNPSFAGRCTETTDVQPGSSPRRACEAILGCLNDTACIKSYCEATTIRQGWALESATPADAPPGAYGEAPHQHEHAAADAETLGTVEFPVSCNAAAQAKFERAVALLHSFWYDEAEKAFTEVTKADARCAMGNWGVAMSLFHPVWAAANPTAAPSPAEMERGRAAAERAKAENAKTERERDYIAAVDTFYQEPGAFGYPTRALAFERAMAQVHRRHPADREAAVFHALALLGTAWPTDKTYAKQKEAAEILKTVLPGAPEHPGVAHYLIHSFDYPGLAELALPAARAYSQIAASSPHALHMPSHIFTRLALWDESIQSNLASVAMAKRHVERTQPGAASFDQLHALDYLAYAYLQQGRDLDAKRVVEEVSAVETLDQPNFAAAYALAAVPARYALERRQWSEAADLTLRPTGFPWSKFRSAEALTQFARGIGGARSGNLGVARSGLERLEAIHAGLLEAQDPYWAGQLKIQQLGVAAWIARAEGQPGEARRLMRAAADLEDSTEKHPVTPGSLLPARELLADLLLDLGEPAPALTEYEASMKLAPGRLNSLAGALRAAEGSGDCARAAELRAKLEALSARAGGARATAALHPGP